MKLSRIILASILVSNFAPLAGFSQTLQLQPLTTFGTNGDGSILPGQRPWLTTGSTRYQRGMAYNPATGHLLVASRALVDTVNNVTNLTPYIAVIDALTGNDVGSLDLSSLAIGSDTGFDINMVAVSDDGAIYAGNMSSKTTTSGFFNLYYWANEGALQNIVYYGDPSAGSTNSGNARWGDTLVVTGTGTSTKLLATSRDNLAAIFAPSDPTLTAVWTSILLQTDAADNDLGYGLAFGVGNTFWAKAASAAGNPLYQFSYNTGAGTATTLHKYGTTVFPGWTGPLMVQTASNLLAGLESPPSGGPGHVRLYDISNTAIPPVLLDRKDWVTNESINGIFSGSIAFGSNIVYALNSDNGIMAYRLVSGPAPHIGPAVTLNPVSETASLANNSAPFIGAADGSAPLAYQWYFNTNNAIVNATNSTLTVSNVQPPSFGGYYFVVTNLNGYGSATSAVANLTEAVSFKNGVVYEPFNYPVGLPLQNLGGWVTNTASVQAQVQGCYMAAGNLSLPGLAAPMGNHYLWASNVTVRLPFGSQTNGPLYFSFLHRGTNITANTGTEDPIGGLAYNSGTTLYPKVDCVWSDSNHYSVGVAKGTGVGYRVTDTQVFTGTDTVFIVCCFVMTNGNAGSDVAQLWVNPDPASFGAAAPPVPNCVTNAGNGSADPAAGVDRLSWRGTTSSFQHEVDELRIGFTWAAVTPPPSVSLSISANANTVNVWWPTNGSSGYNLESTTNLAASVWAPVTSNVQGTNNVATLGTTNQHQFFRLKR